MRPFFDILGWLTISNPKPLRIPPIKPITLYSLKSNSGSHCILKINKTIIEFSTLLGLLFNKSSLNKSWKRPKNMSDLPLMAIIRNSIDI